MTLSSCSEFRFSDLHSFTAGRINPLCASPEAPNAALNRVKEKCIFVSLGRLFPSPWLKVLYCQLFDLCKLISLSQFSHWLPPETIYLQLCVCSGGGTGSQFDGCVLCIVRRLKLIPLYLDSFSASSRAERMPSLFSSSTRSPFWCIWSRMSQPPTNSPLKYT